ncbi:D-alanyl-D-alanine carboxypeptidase [Streptomyces echinatus]|uniref:D-alanyl-D-alanine carboxypeptidase n=1 Tax=Streptomyces echinatus TaxID=67293 RepID=UPI00379ECAC0
MEEASVAGESPDRSKQRESSAEPTSGSAGSVPEARDPRLAVAREKDSSGGGTDTATKILTVRTETPAGSGKPAEQEKKPADAENSATPDEDTALRAAVSAWVREPGTDATAKSEKTEAKAEGSMGTNSESPSDPQEKRGTSPKAAAGDEVSPAAPAKSGSGAPSDAQAGPGSPSRTETEHEAPSATDAEATSDEPTEADADETDENPAADADEKTADAKTGTGEKSTADAKPDADAKRDMDAKSRTRTEAVADAENEADAGADAEAKNEAEAKSRTDADSRTEPDAEADTDADAEAKGDAPAKSGAASKAEDAKAKGGTPAKTGTASKATATAKTEADADAKSDAGAKGDAGAKSDAGAKGDAGAKSDAGAKGDAGAKSDAATESDTAGTGDSAGEGDVVDADGGDGPQGAPADGDESRTGGAGGNTEDAEGEAEADAVDQPTTVFKAVQPKKPGVDQPTTMLKLGGKPKPTESESERTSKFVALRDDMRPAGKPKAPAAPTAVTPKAPAAPKAPVTPPDTTTAVPHVGPERTTQQPLPPKPPLDLLAELTNTPPPPETPVRTAVRRVKIWTPLVLLLAIVFAVVQNFRPLPSPTLSLTAEDTYTFDGKTNLPWPNEGQGWIDGDGIGTMGRFGEQTPVAIGSVAKTMTSYIILRDHPLKPGQEGPKIKIDPTAEKEGGYNKDGESTLDTVKAGQSLTQKQALSAVLIPSANNIARLLARWDVGSEAAFVKKMNATAKELGMTHTTYTDPSGLKETTVSTAEDQVKLGRAFVKVPALTAITSSASWTDPSGKYWDNTNHLPFNIGALGIKTGSTSKAGGNLLFASRKKVGGQTVTLVGAILGQHKPKILETANEVSQTALVAAQKALTSTKILKKGDVVGYVDDRLGGHTPIVVTKDVTAVGWAGLKVKLSFASGTVPHTAKAGTQVGTLTVGDGTAGAVKVPVALQKNLAEPGFGAKLTRLG